MISNPTSLSADKAPPTSKNSKEYFNRRMAAMKTEQSSFVSHWRELSEFGATRRGKFLVTDVNKGDKRNSKIINSAQVTALRIATGGLFAGTMSPARPWFALETMDDDMMKNEEVRQWLFRCEVKLRSIFASEGGTPYRESPKALKELLQFGTGCLLHLDDFENIARFQCKTIGSYYLAQDGKGKTNVFGQEYQWTVEQIVDTYAEKGKDGKPTFANISKHVENMYDRGNYTQLVTLHHVIEPNPFYNPGSPFSFPFRSVIYEPTVDGIDREKFLEKKGFFEFPVHTPRWDTTEGDVYGTDCPGMTALGDVKALQMSEKRKAQALDKHVSPTLDGPASLKNVPISSLPGSAILYDTDAAQNRLKPVYEMKPQLQDWRLNEQAIEQRISRAYFNDIFYGITDMQGIQPKNQLEITHRDAERLLQMGPVLESTSGDFLTPLINRTWAQCVRAEVPPFNQPPRQLEGQPLRIKFISSLMMAQRAVATGGIDRLTGYVTALIGAGIASAAEKFNADQAIESYAAALGVEPALVNSDEAVAAMREANARAQQQQQMLAQAQAMADTAKTASEIVPAEGAPQ